MALCKSNIQEAGFKWWVQQTQVVKKVHHKRLCFELNKKDMNNTIKVNKIQNLPCLKLFELLSMCMSCDRFKKGVRNYVSTNVSRYMQ